MKQRRGSFLKSMEEQLVVLRQIPTNQQDDTITGDWVYCDCKYPKRKFQRIATEVDNLKACILKQSVRVDADGIVVQDAEYRANIIPPFTTLSVSDLVLRIEKNCEELYIDSLSVVQGIQQLELTNRSKTADARY